jgi:ribonuclease HIII
MPLKKTLTDLASDYNLELPTGAESEDVQERKSEIIAKLQGMMRSQEVAQEGQQVMQAEQQAAPMEAEAETQGAPRRPILPPNPSQ